ncbi:MAG: peptide ABC transporter substrate-binding protein [Treponema sp.]|jgi:peptide/nickel transport system substrate-binding protein/oligopeptide transport system substrate-binding protein|nr:peptide ABC transporter substrate-binding protein [Treponema sp.]
MKKLLSMGAALLALAANELTARPVQEDFPLSEQTSPLQDDSEEAFNDVAEARPSPLTRDSLTVTFSAGVMELDFRKAYYASEAQIFTGLYEGLFSYHPFTMKPVPAIASRYELSPDKKQWTFTIREGAKFSNGDPVRAEDFRDAWLSLLSLPDAPYSSLFDIIAGARDFRAGRLSSTDDVGIRVVDGKLVVTLNAPAAFFPSMLCHHSFSPIHPSMLGGEADWTYPVANGPFLLKEKNDTFISLAKNDQYWDVKNVKLNTVVIKFTEDGDEASALWNSGEARWLAGDMNIDMLSDRSGITVNAMFATHYYFIRSKKEPWNDYRVRQALSLALPWNEIRSGLYMPAKTLIYPIPDYPEIEGIDKTDMQEAAALLVEAGFPKGVGLPQLTIRITPSAESDRIANLMADAWFELGVPVKIDIVPYPFYNASLKQDDYEVGAMTWIGDFADPYTFLQMWQTDSNLNDAYYSDADYEDLLNKSMMQEGEERWKTLAEAEELLLNRASVLPISYQPAINIIDTKEISGWFPNVLDIHPFKYLFFATLKPLPNVARK